MREAASFARGTWVVLQKEVRIELRTREILTTAGMFGLLVTVLTSMSFYLDAQSGPRLAPGVLWVATSFAGVLAMGRAWAREREANAIRALLLSPVPHSAIYAGKALATFLLVLAIDAVLLPVVAILFHADVMGMAGIRVGVLLMLGTFGYVAMGTLFAAMSVRTRARDLMLSVVLFPLASPALLAGVVATREVFLGGDAIDGWYRVLLAYDLFAWVSGVTLFETLMND